MGIIKICNWLYLVLVQIEKRICKLLSMQLYNLKIFNLL